MAKCYVNIKSGIVHGRTRNDACRMAEIKEENLERHPSVSAALKGKKGKMPRRLCKLEWKNSGRTIGIDGHFADVVDTK